MSDLTISARLVADGVGLPRVWRSSRRSWHAAHNAVELGDPSIRVDASDPQTVFGLAMRRDEWERARLGGVPVVEWRTWVAQSHSFQIASMLASIKNIGMDHAIRRALGWEVKSGTLATIRRAGSGFWWVEFGGRTFCADHRYAPYLGLADITDPAEALRAIYAEVCGD